MTQQEFDALVEKVGKEAATKIASEMKNYETTAKQLAEKAIKEGGITKEDFEASQSQTKEALEKINEICKTQGTTITELSNKLNAKEVGTKSIGEVLQDNVGELEKVYRQGSGNKYFMLNMNTKGEWVAKPFDPIKAAGPHATVAAVGAGGNTSSISQSIDAASLLRLGGNAPIINQFRNGSWIFDLCNLQTVGFEMPMAMWYEEQVKQGASATVAEGGTKPAVQYAYQLRTASYKKEAALLGFTDEFALDFQRLQSDAIGQGRIDLIGRVNSAVLANILSSATAFNKATEYKAGAALAAGTYNDYIGIDALASQVDYNTFGTSANAAIMSTFKKHRIGTSMDSQGRWLNAPDSISYLNFVGNPAMGTDDIIVGDFSQYNIQLRGGMLMKVGYNGTDFAENRFSVVLEQYYFDYISALRAAAIVKGTTFAAVKTALTT